MPPKKKRPRKPRLFLKREEKIGKGLKTLATLHTESALAELEGNNVSPEPVHNARVCIKKVRSIIQLAAPSLGRTRRDHLLALLKEASSRISPLRDSEVQIQSLDLALEAAGLPAENFAFLRDGLADIAKQRRKNDFRQIPRVLGFLKKVLEDIPEWPLESLAPRDLRRRIRRTYRRGRTIVETCRSGTDRELFHAWRKLVKQLGYQLRITAKYWPEDASRLIAEISQIGELAGRERDYTLLLLTLNSGPRTRAAGEVAELLSAQLPELRHRAIESGLRFYEPKPRIFIEPLDL